MGGAVAELEGLAVAGLITALAWIFGKSSGTSRLAPFLPSLTATGYSLCKALWRSAVAAGPVVGRELMLSSRLLEVCELALHLSLSNTWPTVLVMAALGSSISASLAMTVLGALVFVVCSLANVVPEIGIMATLNVSRAAGAAVQRC